VMLTRNEAVAADGTFCEIFAELQPRGRGVLQWNAHSIVQYLQGRRRYEDDTVKVQYLSMMTTHNVKNCKFPYRTSLITIFRQ
jgi:hypothetical protein